MKIKNICQLLLVISSVFFSSAFATPVNINHADAQTISQSLVGVSLKKAEAIVINREKNGTFKSIDDLKRVIGIGNKTIALNRENILLSDKKTITNNRVVPNLSLPPHQPESDFPWLVTLTIILIAFFSVIAIIKYRLHKNFFRK